MTAPEFRAALAELGVTQAWFAGVTGTHKTTVTNWARGLYPVPPTVALILGLLRQLAEVGTTPDRAVEKNRTHPKIPA